jgi:hypothetical protein
VDRLVPRRAGERPVPQRNQHERSGGARPARWASTSALAGPAKSAASGLFTDTDRRRDSVDRTVKVAFKDAKGLHGSPHLHADLRDAGWEISEKTVAESMRRQGLVARVIKRRGGLTRQDKTKKPFPDLLCRDFTAPEPNCRWVGDITEIPTAEGKLYLATVIDLYSRRLLGAATSAHPDAELACAAIRMAVTAWPVELGREESRRGFQDRVRAPQLGVLPLQPLQLRRLLRCGPRPRPGIDLGLADPLAHRLQRGDPQQMSHLAHRRRISLVIRADLVILSGRCGCRLAEEGCAGCIAAEVGGVQRIPVGAGVEEVDDGLPVALRDGRAGSGVLEYLVSLGEGG